MATLTVGTVPGRTGRNLSSSYVAVDAVGNDKFANNGNVMVAIWNHTDVDLGTPATLTVTIVCPSTKTVDGAVIPNKTYAVASGDSALLGPFPTTIYNDTSGLVRLNWSTTTDIYVYAFTTR